MNPSEKPALMETFDLLFSTYGPQGWWPADSPFEVIVGAVLTQNTAWQNVAKAVANLKREGLVEASALLEADPETVKALIGPAGFFNVKYDRIMNVLEYLVRHDLHLEGFRRPVADLRAELIQVNGVGPETADSILLYAFERPVFVVDAYTRRLFSRLGYGWMEKAPYDRIQEFFMKELASDYGLYNEFHALIVAHGKDTCKQRSLCQGCCLSSLCPGRQ